VRRHAAMSSFDTLLMKCVYIFSLTDTVFSNCNTTGDMTVVMIFGLSVVLNLAMFSQYWIYKANTDSFLEELQKKKKE